MSELSHEIENSIF